MDAVISALYIIVSILERKRKKNFSKSQNFFMSVCVGPSVCVSVDLGLSVCVCVCQWA